MRREEEKAGRRKKRLGLIMIIVMFGSVFTFIFFGFQTGRGSSGIVDYNGFEFINRGSYWSTIINGREALFTYLPTDLGFIFLDNDVINLLTNKVQIDVTSDFNDTLAEPIALAQFQMGSTLNNFNIFLRSGFTSQRQNFPVITCDDATSFVPAIYFRGSNVTRVHLENNCIIAQAASPSEVIRIKDALVYSMFGII